MRRELNLAIAHAFVAGSFSVWTIHDISLEQWIKAGIDVLFFASSAFFTWFLWRGLRNGLPA